MIRFLSLPVLLAVLSLTACRASDPDPRTGSILNGNIFANTGARGTTQNVGYGDVTGAALQESAAGSFSRSYNPEGSGAPSGLAVAEAPTGGGGGSYTLNFENADVKDVIRAVLRDALQLNYTISGNVSGPVTISSSRAVTRDELLATLEASLDSLGFSLTREGDSYRVAPTGLGGAVDPASRTRPGYGVSVVPLRFVPASTMLELLSGFVTESESLKIGTTKNTIIVRGSGAERTQAVRAIQSFDADWMENQSVAIIALREARPEAVIPELERIFGAEGDDGVITFRSIPRLRGILAIARTPDLVRRAQSWVQRLDQSNPNAGDNVFVYKARNRDAAELAKVMTNLFGGGAQGSAASAVRPRNAEPAGNDEGAFGSVTQSPEADLRVASAFEGPGDTTDEGFGVGVAPGVIDLTTQGAAAAGSSSGVRISADPSNNSVVTYADADSYRQILAAMRELDSTPVQVAVNVIIAEVQLTDELRYGVQYYVNSRDLGLNGNQGSLSLTDVASSVLQSQIPGFNFVLGSDENPDVIISALDVISDVEILSSPSLVVLENQTATLQVGDEVPVTTRQAQNVENGLAPIVNQVEFRDTGIILNVTPRVGQNDAVTMQVEQEISAVVSASNTLTPTISKRRVASEISVQNGQTVLLAGLISSNAGNDRRGIPVVGRVPILGNLFSTTAKTADRTELVILIRPVVVRTSQDAASVAAELKAQMWGIGGRQTPLK